ncbi:putative ABC transporter ATP-binding protein [Intestinibaculum porci]|uniref:Putative ABC transporter ATP-binding protein n=1 Tax=Intestinibaculum porci TaxID=2487118 RepID=A0A3G9J9T6_9FIRM|nr:ABC transporter ATP-binding protein [Intestinibaculum porci]BBH25135.1 putative ABC transporter ATP-binding protein [Intestinibaculum porci]
MAPIIEFKDFSFKYRAQKDYTLHDINLTINEGEKVLIIGPSGSGKSTLSQCLNGLIPHSYPGKMKGHLTVNGKNPKKAGIFGMSETVGTVLQDTDGQFIGLTVAEDIAFALENDCVKQEEMKKRVHDVAHRLSIEKLLDHRPNELSGGQKQRVSLAGVMVDDVDILLFDEPLANLDPATGKNTIELIDEIHKQTHKTIIIIEHRLEDVLYKDVDRIIMINDGRIVADMSSDALLASSLLEEAGIREPLYLTACKYAGVTITQDMHPSHIESFDVSRCKEALQKWYEKTPVKVKDNNNQTILSVKDVSFAYDAQNKVLEHVSFDIKEGEMVSIVGRNGAGKSTLSSLICGFMPLTEGQILLEGQDISPLSIRERGEKIGFVMQNPNHMISKSMIFEEVALGLEVRGVPKVEIEERVNETLRICGLYPFRNWPISALSFGQKKRMTIASILVLNPKILILDEPTAGQDFRHYTEIMEFLKMLNREHHVTIIMITHDMHLMLEYTHRALVLSEGHLLADASPAKVLTDKQLTQAAYLKRTSLYDLSKKCDLSDPSAFVERFIAYDEEARNHG